MDQLRLILQHAKKHHFWLVCAACLIIGMLAWMKAAGNLSGEYSKRKSAITSKFSALDVIMSEPVFPNAQWSEGADQLTNEQKKKVRTAWKLVYDEQTQFLNWPEQLGDDFVARVKSSERRAELPRPFRARYMNSIQREFPKLLQIVGAESHDADKQSGRAPMVQEKVIWDDASQQAIEESLRFETAPSSLEVWLTQENLWIYRVLLTVIKQVNAGSIVPPVKQIDQLLIAQEAADEFENGMASGRIERPKTAKPATGSRPSGPPPGPPGQGTETPSPDDGRYVDADGKPQRAGSGGSEPFRRMPIFMKLKIDQRQIPRLLAACANSPLPVEVRQLRITSSRSRPASSGSSNSGPTPGGAGAGVAPYDVPIEIAGIIYIYNPPDTAKLGADEPDAAAPPSAAGG